MKPQTLRILSFLLALVTLLGVLVPGAISENASAAEQENIYYENTHVNTGNQRYDILAIALTQLGYTETGSNDSKYGSWYGMPYQPWCAMFISWCARQADISTDILRRSAVADPDWPYFDIPYYSSDVYTPQPGDLFFTKNFSHVGFVYYVEGEYFYTCEGNSNILGSTDGLYVISNKRELEDYYFGVPAYKGGDKEHNYVKGQDAAHPHKTYYQCQTCGDKYYTGYTVIVPGCSSCISCGCSQSGAGYYINTLDEPLNVRSGHGYYYDRLGCVATGDVVHVLGVSANGWAYVDYDGLRGHVALEYLEKYYDRPASPTVTLNQVEYVTGDTLSAAWNTPAHTEKFRVKLYKDGQLLAQQDLGMTAAYKTTLTEAGEYALHVAASNKTGSSAACVKTFTVRDTYTVTYDVREGETAPAAQTQVLGQVLQLCQEVPARSGYSFLGWTEDPESSFVTYEPGDYLSSDKDMTLYAVWKSDSATLEKLEIERLPARSIFLVGESLDTTGLELRLTYSDGSGHLVTDGFTTDGFQSGELGMRTVNVTYDTLTVCYQVQIASYIPGDIDLNKTVNRDDVMQLLWHISFPDRFPIETPADFNHDGSVNRDDVMQLLWHISFPDKFPLETEGDQEEDLETPGETEVTDSTDPANTTETTEPTDSTESTDPTEPPETTDPTAGAEEGETK